MKRITGCLILMAFSVVSVAQTATSALGKANIKIEVTHAHSHDHGDGHHTHEMPGGTTSSEEQSSDQPSSNHQDSHTHVITLVSSPAITLPSGVVISYPVQTSDVKPSVDVKSPPEDLSLNSIFRPPIQA